MSHTNTQKLQAQTPQTLMSSRRATRIPQSSRLNCLKPSCRAEGPHEYLKAPGSIASNPHVAPAGHTNTSKFQAQLPQNPMSHRRATRIPKSSRLNCLQVPCRAGRPHEYLKAPRPNASRSQVEPAGKKTHMTPSIWEKPLSSRSFAHL